MKNCRCECILKTVTIVIAAAAVFVAYKTYDIADKQLSNIQKNTEVAAQNIGIAAQNTRNDFLLRIEERYGSKELLRAKAILKRFSMGAVHFKQSANISRNDSDVKSETTHKQAGIQEGSLADKKIKWAKQPTNTLGNDSRVKIKFEDSDMQKAFFAGENLGASTMLRMNKFYSDDPSEIGQIQSKNKGLKQIQLQLENMQSQIKKEQFKNKNFNQTQLKNMQSQIKQIQSGKIQNWQNDNKFEDLVYVESLYEFLTTVNHFFKEKYITDAEITKMLGKSFAFYSGLCSQYKKQQDRYE